MVPSETVPGSDPGEECKMSAAEVVGVGNAIVDVIGQVPDSAIDEWGLNRGSMTLIDEPRAEELTGLMPDGLKESGGSAANTMVGVASFGRSAAYIGKVRDDSLGDVFIHDIRHAGVQFDVTPAESGPATARCMIQVTPDGQRTMNTFLGASSVLTVADIDESLVAGAKLLYCEGYLWDLDEAKQAIRHAMDIAAANGVTASLTLSDPFAVDRHRDEWLALIADRVDLLFGNRDEVYSLLGTDREADIISSMREMTQTACITKGAEGSMIITPTEVIEIPVVEVLKRVDTTGAGDLYASGVLAGIAQGFSLDVAGRMGSCAAAEVITHIGARPLEALTTLC
jgi:sugar/nucleoside kinase (ribokinase family)